MFAVILLLAIAIGQEVLARLIFPVPEILNFNRIQYSRLHHADAGEAGSGPFLSNASYVYPSDPDDVEFVHTLNLYGFRDRQWTVAKPVGRERVMFIGDSFVEGAMAPDDSTITEGFSAASQSGEGEYDVMNLGVQGMGLPVYVQLMADAIPVFSPDIVVIVFFENDFFEPPPFDPEWLYGLELEPRLSSAWTPRMWHVVQSYLDGNPNARRWVSAPFSFYASTPSPRNPISRPDNAEYYRRVVDPEILAAMRAGRFNPFVIDGYAIDEVMLRKPVDISEYLLAFQRLSEKHGCRLCAAYIPKLHQVSDYYIPYQLKFSRHHEVRSMMSPEYQIHAAALSRDCKSLKIPFLDFTPLLRKLESKGKRMYWNYDNHMNGAAYLYVGREIFTRLVEPLTRS